MRRYLYSILWMSILCQPVISAPIQLITGAPSTYQPGQPVEFDVRLPAVSNLGSYNVDLVLESAMGTAGVDFFFDVSATIPASANYVLSSSANFFDAANVDSPTRHRFTLTDFDFAGVDVVAGINDQVAHVVINTTPTFAGQLSIFVDADGLILDTPDINPTPVSGFDALKSDIAASGPIGIDPVPEPSATVLLVWALAAGCIRRWTL